MADSIIEDKPPMIRFESTAERDGIKCLETGRENETMNVLKVFIRAAGDSKCEVPDIARKTGYDTHTKTVEVERQISKWKEDPETGDLIEHKETVRVPEEKTFYAAKSVTPWLDKVRERYRNEGVSEDYMNWCIRAQSNYEANLEMPIDGTPLATWMGCDEATKKRAIDLGINSVEKLAEMSAEAMENMGMGALSLKNKAKAFVEADQSPAIAAAKMANLESDNQEMKDALSEQAKKIAELMSRGEEKKAGKPRKEATAA